MRKLGTTKETVRKYYKYLIDTFEQPTLSANGTIGGSSFAVYSAQEYLPYVPLWKGFDNNTPDVGGIGFAYGSIGEVIVYNSNGLNISNINFTATSANGASGATGTVYVSNDNTTWTEITSFSQATASNDWSIPLSYSGYYKYLKLSVTSTSYASSGSYWWYLGNTILTATEQIITESTESDYDFYEDVEQYKAFIETIRKYYKYITAPWTPPVLSANGTLGGDSFAVATTNEASQPLYKAFDRNINTYWSTDGLGLNTEITFYNPVAINITQISYDIYDSGHIYYNAPEEGIISGSNDGTNWEEIDTYSIVYNSNPNKVIEINNSNYYKYYKWKITNSSCGNTYSGTWYHYLIFKQIRPTGFILADEVNWYQPVLFSNGTLGNDSFACWASSENGSNYAWHAFDGVITTANSNYWSAAGNVVPADLVFYNPYPLNVTNLRITNSYYSSQQGITAGIVYASNDNSVWTELKQFTNTAVASNAQWNIELSNNTGFYKYYKLHVTDTAFTYDSAKYIQIMDVLITATPQFTEETTEDDNWDYYIDAIKYNACGYIRKGNYGN